MPPLRFTPESALAVLERLRPEADCLAAAVAALARHRPATIRGDQAIPREYFRALLRFRRAAARLAAAGVEVRDPRAAVLAFPAGGRVVLCCLASARPPSFWSEREP